MMLVSEETDKDHFRQRFVQPYFEQCFTKANVKAKLAGYDRQEHGVNVYTVPEWLWSIVEAMPAVVGLVAIPRGWSVWTEQDEEQARAERQPVKVLDGFRWKVA